MHDGLPRWGPTDVVLARDRRLLLPTEGTIYPVQDSKWPHRVRRIAVRRRKPKTKMTAIFGWQDGPEVFLIGDSAVTSSHPPRGKTSSFGEAVIQEDITVEEAAIKIVELPRSLIVGVAGSSRTAMNYLETLTHNLRQGDRPIREILEGVAQSFRGNKQGFQMLVGHPHDGGMALTRVRTTDPVISPVGNATAILGSLPERRKAGAAHLISVIRSHGLPPEGRLAAAIALLQAGGITDYLPAYGVGGTLFGARTNLAGVTWQPDMMFFVYPPKLFGESPILRDEDTPTFSAGDRLGMVRVLVRRGAGIVLSSLGHPKARVFIPPAPPLTELQWRDVAVAAVPPPFELIASCRYYGFLNTGFRKAVFCGQLGSESGAVGVSVAGTVGRRQIRIAPRLVQTLEDEVPGGYFDFSVVTEDATGVDCKTYRLHEAALG